MLTLYLSWRRIKRDLLHHFHKPRLDLLVWIIVTKLAPTYYRKLDVMMESQARYRELPSWRKEFKRAWKKAAKTPITMPLNDKYRPNPRTWVCTCPEFRKSRFLLCKHLVQSCHPVPPVFFLQVRRNRTTPFWKHEKLVPLVMDNKDTVFTDERVVGSEMDVNESDCDPSDGEESDGDVIDTEGADIVGGLTFGERIEARVAMLRDFADGLEYQLQFGDSRMLDRLEREGTGFFRMAESCLSRERRLNSTRGASPTTWEKATSSAMFYRTRPRHADKDT